MLAHNKGMQPAGERTSRGSCLEAPAANADDLRPSARGFVSGRKAQFLSTAIREFDHAFRCG